jgi:cytochrome c-type biogenesis protein CcmH/NrfG
MKNRCVQVLVLALAAAASAAVCRPVFAQTEPLRGTVFNKTDNPIKNVEVVLRTADAAEVIDEQITDEDGGFTIPMESLRPGYELHFRKDGYNDVTLPITPQQLVVASISVVMQPTFVAPSSQRVNPTPTPPPSLVIPEQRKKAIELYNKGVAAWEKAKSASDANEPAEKKAALMMIRQSASLDPTFAEPLIMLSRLAMKNQNWAEASRYSEDLIRIDPNDIDAIRTLYFSMVIMRHHIRIGDAARRLAKADPNTIASIEEHALAFFQNEVYLMAKAMYEALTEISPDPVNAYLNLGLSCAALGDVDGTRAAFEAFLERAPADHPYIETIRQDLAALDAPAIPPALDSQEPLGPIK